MSIAETGREYLRVSLMPCITAQDADGLMRLLLEDKRLTLVEGQGIDAGKLVTAKRRIGDADVFFTCRLIDAGRTAELVLVFEDPATEARPRHETHFTFSAREGWSIDVNDDQGYRRARPDFADRPKMPHVEAIRHLRRAMDIAAPANLPA